MSLLIERERASFTWCPFFLIFTFYISERYPYNQLLNYFLKETIFTFINLPLKPNIYVTEIF